jgi:hypothetical protein
VNSGEIVPAFCLTCEGDTVEIKNNEFVFDLHAYMRTTRQALVPQIQQEVAPDLKNLVEEYLK